MRFYFDKSLKYTNRRDIDLSLLSYIEKEYIKIDLLDGVNAKCIYLDESDNDLGIPTYILDISTSRRYFVTAYTYLSDFKYSLTLVRDLISENRNYMDCLGVVTNTTSVDLSDSNNLAFINDYENNQRKKSSIEVNKSGCFAIFYQNEKNLNTSTGEVSELDLHVKYSGLNANGNVVSTTQSYIDKLLSISNKNIGYINDKDAFIIEVGGARRQLSIKDQYKGGLTRIFSLLDWIKKGDEASTKTLAINQFRADEGNWSSESGLSNRIYYNPYIETDPWVYGGDFWTLFYEYNNYFEFLKTFAAEFEQCMCNALGLDIIRTLDIPLEVNKGTNIVYHCTDTDKYFSVNCVDSGITAENHQFLIDDFPNSKAFLMSDSNRSLRGIGYCRFLNTFINSYIISVNEISEQEALYGIGFDITLRASAPVIPALGCKVLLLADTHDGVGTLFDDDSVVSEKQLYSALSRVRSFISASLDTETTGRILDIQYLPFSLKDAGNAESLRDFIVDGYNTSEGDKVRGLYLATNYVKAFNYIELNLYKFSQINPNNENLLDLVSRKYVLRSVDNQFIKSLSIGEDFNMETTSDGYGCLRFNSDLDFVLRPSDSYCYFTFKTGINREYKELDGLSSVTRLNLSFTLLDSNWASFIAQNKNYNLVFNRDLADNDFKRNHEREMISYQRELNRLEASGVTMNQASPIVNGIMSTTGLGLLFPETAKGIGNLISYAHGKNNPNKAVIEGFEKDIQYNEDLYNRTVQSALLSRKWSLGNTQSVPDGILKSQDFDCLVNLFASFFVIDVYEIPHSVFTVARKDFELNGISTDYIGVLKDFVAITNEREVRLYANILESDFYTESELKEINRRLKNGILLKVNSTSIGISRR